MVVGGHILLVYHSSYTMLVVLRQSVLYLEHLICA